MPPETLRRICFVSGTRAEFGLMRSTLSAIVANPSLELQLVVTGMHLNRSRGRSLDAIRREGWKINAVIPWTRGDGTETANAVATGKAIASMAEEFARLKSDIVLVTGDRVEAFAAASAAHLGGRLLAHVHGGDRALGLVDDSLRHAITKLAHVHFPATKLSAERIKRMGEDRWRIFRAGSPGLDGLRALAAPRKTIAAELAGLSPRRYAILLLHPQSTDTRQQRDAAEMLLRAIRSVGFDRIVIIFPNNDPGSEGIAMAWDALPPDERLIIRRDMPRPLFLGALRDAAVLVGNSSSGIIEAASFGTAVLDIGTRQTGRERGANVVHVEMKESAIARELRRIWNDGRPVRFTSHNIYGSGGAGRRIASTLSRIAPSRFLHKLIAF
jgi:UDP-hydrolysing UDP-N-acetyl-D-glucosamine 2-epimerase